jgi:hypothetical protein
MPAAISTVAAITWILIERRAPAASGRFPTSFAKPPAAQGFPPQSGQTAFDGQELAPPTAVASPGTFSGANAMPTKPATLKVAGPEIRLAVSDVTDAAVLKDGSIVVASNPQTDDDAGLHVQRFSATGAALGGPGTLPSDSQQGKNAAGAEITPLADGGFTVIWTSAYSHSVWGEFARFDASARFVSGGGGSGGGYLTDEAVIARPDGGWVHFEADGSLFGANASLSVGAVRGDGTELPERVFGVVEDLRTAGLNYGDLTGVAWGDNAQLFWGNRQGLRTALFGPDGMKQERLLSATGGEVDATRLRDGRVAATWVEHKGADAFVYETTFDPARMGRCSHYTPQKVLVAQTHDVVGATDPEIVALKDGGFALSWHAGDAGGHTQARVYSATGQAGAVFAAEGDFIGTDAQGRVVSTRLDGDGELFVERYTVAGPPAGPVVKVADIHVPDIHVPKIQIPDIHLPDVHVAKPTPPDLHALLDRWLM